MHLPAVLCTCWHITQKYLTSVYRPFRASLDLRPAAVAAAAGMLLSLGSVLLLPLAAYS